jgi:hypothetical protein
VGGGGDLQSLNNSRGAGHVPPGKIWILCLWNAPADSLKFPVSLCDVYVQYGPNES